MVAPDISNAATRHSAPCCGGSKSDGSKSSGSKGDHSKGDGSKGDGSKGGAMKGRIGFQPLVISLPSLFLMALIRAYQLLVSPLLPPSCRFHPSCSQFSLDAVEMHGALKGGWSTLMRLLRCHPFHPGGFDPVPHRWRLWPPSSQQHILTD